MADRVVEYVVVVGLASRKRARSSSPAIKEGLSCRFVRVYMYSPYSPTGTAAVHVHVHM